MQFQETIRGFRYAEFQDANGDTCIIQESSAISDADDAYDNPGSSYLWLGFECSGYRVHLSRERAREIAEAINVWLDTKRLPEAGQATDGEPK